VRCRDVDPLSRLVAKARDFLASPKAIREAALAVEGPTKWRFIEDPDLTTSYEVLFKLQGGALDRSGAVEEALAGLMAKGAERDAEVGFREITGLAASKGRFIGNLSRLWPTSGSIGKLEPSADNIAMIRQQVWAESGCVWDGRFHLYEECWSGRLIARNTGTARRIAWLHHYSFQDHSPIPARITPLVLDQAALKVLTEDYWIALLPTDDGAWTLASKLEEIGVRGTESVGVVWSPACPDEDDRTRWSMLACNRASRRYADVRMGLMDSTLPVFDLSQWLTAMADGRGRP
jgi:hypothetical protein